MTQPWGEKGSRILPARLYQDYTKRMDELRVSFEREVNLFVSAYPLEIDRRRRELGDMFNPRDYVDPRKVHTMFEFDVAIYPCPDADDFRVDLAEGHAADIKRDIEQRMKSALEDAMQEPVRRIVEVVGRMAERLRTYKPSEDTGTGKSEGVFRDSLVTNVRDLATLLPAFNLTDDPAISHMAQRIQTELCIEDAKALREHVAVRESVAQSAEDILAAAKQFLA
jgi:hypothetical protein